MDGLAQICGVDLLAATGSCHARGDLRLAIDSYHARHDGAQAYSFRDEGSQATCT